MERKYTKWDTKEETPARFRQTVNTLIEMLIKPECLKRDLFFALLLTLMKENNFQLLNKIDDESTAVEIVDYIISNKNQVTCEALFVLKGYENISLRLFACPIDDIVLITSTLPHMCSETYSLCLLINDYFTNSSLGIPANLTNINNLCIRFKDKIVSPIKSTILRHNSSPSGALVGLPADILHQILLNLSLRDILNLSESCRRIQGIVNEDCVWFHLYSRDFSDSYKQDGKGKGWREIYKDTYIMKQRQNNLTSNIRVEIFDDYLEMSERVRYIPDSRWEVIL